MKQFRQRGGTMLEAAFAILILFAFLIGILDLGRGYNVYQIATNAAREAARYGVAPEVGTQTLPSSNQIKLHAKAYLDSGNVACPDMACISVDAALPQTVNGKSQLYTRVTVNIEYELIAAQLLGLPNTTNLHLHTSATMRNENN